MLKSSDTLQKVVIVGASHGGVAAATQLRRSGFTGQITIIGAERHEPYHRPPISKSFDSASVRQPLLTAAAAAENGIELRVGSQVERIDRLGRRVLIEDGSWEDYDVLVLATGARPRSLACGGADLPGVLQIRTVDDGVALASMLKADSRVVIIGGGWIGLEVAAAARKFGAEVTILEQHSRILQRAGSAELARELERIHADQGVRIRTGTAVQEIRGGADGVGYEVHISEGQPLETDFVVVGIGAIPDTSLAKEAGLDCDLGILIDERCATSDPRIFALGDATQPREGRRLESIPSIAVQSSALTSRLLDLSSQVDEIPWFWSNQGDLRIQIAGLIRPQCVSSVHELNEDSLVVVHADEDGNFLALEALGAPEVFEAAQRMIGEGRKIDVLNPPAELLAPGKEQQRAGDGHESESRLCVQFVHAGGGQTSMDSTPGHSLMDIGVAAGVPWMIGECGGQVSCGTCRVYVDSPWLEQLDDVMPEEEDLLEFSGLSGPGIRLGCQIRLESHLDGIVVTEPD